MIHCSATILITEDNKCCFQHRDNISSIAYPNHLSLIAGVVEEDESPANCAYRELKEEIAATDNTFPVFLSPISLFYFRVGKNKIEHIHISSVDKKSHELKLLEGQGFIFSQKLMFPDDFCVAPHHQYALYILNNILYGGLIMKTCKYYSVFSLGLKKDYSTMVSTGGFVDKTTVPIASIIPKESANYMALLEFKDRIPRGNHFHKEKIEYMVILDGEMLCELYVPDEEKEIIDLKTGQCIRILPGCIHTYTAINGNCIAFEYSPQQYDSNDTVAL